MFLAAAAFGFKHGRPSLLFTAAMWGLGLNSRIGGAIRGQSSCATGFASSKSWEASDMRRAALQRSCLSVEDSECVGQT